MKNNIYVGLVHHPVYNKFNDVVTTSITNLDVHDISRTCLTFGIKKYFLINHLDSQRKIFSRIIDFWKQEIAGHYNPDRVKALSIIEFSPDIKSVIEKIKIQEKIYPTVITTTAIKRENQLSFTEFQQKQWNKPVLLLFGTGNGLIKELHDQADYVLEPISGSEEYNHLSVRSAVAIVLDRIFSDK